MDVRLPGTAKKKVNVIKIIGNYERILAEDPDEMEKYCTTKVLYAERKPKLLKRNLAFADM